MKYIKSLEKFLEDARMGDNIRLKGDVNSEVYKMFKNGQENSFKKDSKLIKYIPSLNLKINYYDIDEHSIVERIVDRAKSFKSITEFNEYIISKSPIIIDKIESIDRSGKYCFYDKEYNITLIIYLILNNVNKIKIITIINDLNEVETLETFFI